MKLSNDSNNSNNDDDNQHRRHLNCALSLEALVFPLPPPSTHSTDYVPNGGGHELSQSLNVDHFLASFHQDGSSSTRAVPSSMQASSGAPPTMMRTSTLVNIVDAALAQILPPAEHSASSADNMDDDYDECRTTRRTPKQ